jgi:hypothetical protein
MKFLDRKSVMASGIVLVAVCVFQISQLPGDVRFAAPHEGRFGALVAKISLNPRFFARIIDPVLQLSFPTVYACGAPPCDGTKAVADPTGVNGQPYCWYDGTNYSCAKMTCAYVGGSNLCNGPYQTDCKIPYHPGIYCHYANKLSCQ